MRPTLTLRCILDGPVCRERVGAANNIMTRQPTRTLTCSAVRHAITQDLESIRGHVIDFGLFVHYYNNGSASVSEYCCFQNMFTVSIGIRLRVS
jgi:hypothetical protein